MKRLLKFIFPSFEWVLLFITAIFSTGAGALFWTNFHPLAGIGVGVIMFLYMLWPFKYILDAADRS